MGATYKSLVNIKVVTDHDTGMYQMGEVDGCFQEEELKEYINMYGVDGLLRHISYLQYQVFKAYRESNSEEVAQYEAQTILKQSLDEPVPPPGRIIKESENSNIREAANAAR